jgi:cellobiose epimerase
MTLLRPFALALAMLPVQRVTARPPPTPQVYRALADETETNLQREILDKWFPSAFDASGGFFQNFNSDWTRASGQSKAIVYESRLTWTAAEAAARFPDKREMYLAQTRHGLAFLADKMWDHRRGGFFWNLDDAGNPVGQLGAQKLAYGNAFGIFAAATNYQITHDPLALELAQRAFHWFDQHAHDAKNGGYLEIASDGGSSDSSFPNPIGTHGDEKSMNTSIHLLEAFTSLYQAWPDPIVRARLSELFEIVRDRIYREPGYLALFFSPDWKPRPSTPDSFGHDVETAYLLTEAAAALGMPYDAKTWLEARRLVDHAMKVGLDHTRGGLYNEGAPTGGDYSSVREWWVQAEWLNALLLMHERYGRETPVYWDAFVDEWNWINRHGIDRTDGGWYPQLDNDGNAIPTLKSDAWTDCYHQARAMLNVSARLRKLADDK